MGNILLLGMPVTILTSNIIVYENMYINPGLQHEGPWSNPVFQHRSNWGPERALLRHRWFYFHFGGFSTKLPLFTFFFFSTPFFIIKSFIIIKNIVFYYKKFWSSLCGTAEKNPTRNHEVIGLIPRLAQWVTLWNCCELWHRVADAGSDLVLLWLWFDP